MPTTQGGDPLNPNSSTHHGWNSPHADYNETMRNSVRRLEAEAIKNNWDQAKIQQEIQKLQAESEKKLKNGELQCG